MPRAIIEHDVMVDTGPFELELHQHSVILNALKRGDMWKLWELFDVEDENVEGRTFRFFRTNRAELPDEFEADLTYINTFFYSDRDWHLFEIK